MQAITSLALLAVIFASSAADHGLHPLSDEYIALINQRAKTWTAGRNFEMHEWDRVLRLSNGARSKNLTLGASHRTNPHDESESVPEYFDSREAWSECRSLFQIWNQGDCGTCWALGAVAAMSDRICIHSGAAKQFFVSPDNLIGCCWGYCGEGCNGGFIIQSWEFWQSNGIVTGGLYDSHQGCQDYSVSPSASEADIQNPGCKDTCYDSWVDYDQSMTYGGEVFIFDNEKQIQLEIMKNGPVEAAFTVYDDFDTYRSGVYQATSSVITGSHCVKILGWGVENGVKYWLIANSWDTYWGDNGYFKFLRGVNHCDMERGVAASIPRP